MKAKHTKARKANRLCIRYHNSTTEPVLVRRIKGLLGADHYEFDRKHPELSGQVAAVLSVLAEHDSTFPCVSLRIH